MSAARRSTARRISTASTRLLLLVAALAMMWLPTGGQARADTPPAPTQVRLDSWMGDLAPRIAGTPLNRIAMPGSHDAGSWSITARSGQCRTGYIYDLARGFPQLAASVARTQRVSIAEQLSNGSRYVDLRLCKQDGHWFTFHGSPLGSPFFEPNGEAEQIGRWIAAHPSEIVVVSLSVSAPPAELPAATAEAYDRFAAVAGTARLAPRTRFAPTSTYGSLVAAGKNVILLDDSGLADRDGAWSATATSSGRGSYPADSPPAGNYLRDFASPQALFAETLARDRAALARDPGGDAGKFFVMAGIVQPDTLLGLAGLQQSFTALPDSMTCVAGSFHDPRNGGECWACPAEYVRNITPVTQGDACWLPSRAVSTAATYVRNETWAWNCPAGTFWDPRMDAFPWQGQCWSCPPDHLRNVTPVTSANACWRMTPLRQAPAAFRGPSGINRTFLLDRAASYNALLHQQLLGPWKAPELRRNLNIVAVDDVTGAPDGLQPGDLARAVIAYNTQ
ncbi:hypothetical protein ACIGBL_33940 [Streptomyces sp. NPDC085614]|uniref:hypothetical protein n=1 Tax=Streptomyces sp. NPDC085614 TaxID=3365733 RepID=UPI0037CEBFD5